MAQIVEPPNLTKPEISAMAAALGKLGKGKPKTMTPAALAARLKGSRNSAIARAKRKKANGVGSSQDRPARD